MVNRGFGSLIKLIEYKILTLQTSHGVRFRKVVGDTLASEKNKTKGIRRHLTTLTGFVTLIYTRAPL